MAIIKSYPVAEISGFLIIHEHDSLVLLSETKAELLIVLTFAF